MKIVSLKIQKFRGVENTEYNFNKVNIFKGSNGVGKTTCLDALTMLLCGETYTYDKDATKNRDMNNEREVNDISMVVETDDEVYNEEGQLVKVEQIFGCKMYEQYKGKKSEKTDEYVGFKTDWQLNGKKVSEKDYFSNLKQVFNIDYDTDIKNFNIFRFLIDYNYTNTCDYKAIKQFIESILNIKPDAEILKQEQFRQIAYDVMQNKYDVKATNTAYNTKIKQLNDIINASNAVLSNLKAIISDNEAELNKLSSEDEIADKIAKIHKKEEIDPKLMKQLGDLGGKLNALVETKKTFMEAEKARLTSDLRNKIASLEEKHKKYELLQREEIEHGNNNRSLKGKYENDEKNYKAENEKLIIAIDNLQKETFVIEYCPECGCELNKDKKKAYEENKGATILKYSNQIALNNNLIDDIEKKLPQLEKEFKEYQTNYLEAKKTCEAIDKEKEEIMSQIFTLTDSISTETIDKEMDTIQTEITNLHNIITEKCKLSDEDKQNLADLEEMLNTIDSREYAIEQANNSMMAENGKLEKALDEKCKVEAKQIALDEFKQYKTDLIKQNTHKVFGDINWVLQEESKANSDSKKDKCYATLGNVSMDGVNTASKLVLGAKIIACVKKCLGVNGFPLVFDIVDNIGKKALLETESIEENQIFCTKAEFEDGVNLYLEATEE